MVDRQIIFYRYMFNLFGSQWKLLQRIYKNFQINSVELIVFNIILTIPIMKSLNARGFTQQKFYNCMTRQTLQTNQATYCYKLHSYARYNISPLQLYLLYFPSFFTQKYDKQWKHNNSDKNIRETLSLVFERNLSIFFQAYCRHLVLHSLLHQEEKVFQDLVKSVEQDSKSIKSNGQAFGKFVKDLMTKVYHGQYQQLNIKKSKIKQQWKWASTILSLMQQNIEKLIKNIQDNPKIVEDQSFPAANKDIGLLPLFIKRNFDKIRNIHLIMRQKKKQMLQFLQEQYGQLFSIRIPLLKETKHEQDKIYMQRKTLDKQPILIALPIYIKNIYKFNKEFSFQIAKDVIKLFSDFLKQNKRPFPNLKPNMISFSQKSLQAVYDQAYIILDCIGLSGDTNTIQQDIVFSATPRAFDYQKCFLQYNQEIKWLLMKKYYGRKKKQQIDNDDSSQENFIKIDGKIVEEKLIFQHIHIWRLICVLYTIFNSKTQHPEALAFKIYQHFYGNTPFFMHKYIEALKRMDNYVKKGKISLRELFNIITKQSQTRTQFRYTMPEVCKQFNISDDEDSIINSLRFQSTFNEFSLRVRLIQQLTTMLSDDKYFKRIINAKKYAIIYLAQASEYFYQNFILAHLQKQQIGARKKFFLQKFYIRNQSFSHQRQERYKLMQRYYTKLIEYSLRIDSQYIYLSQNQSFMQILKQMSQKLEYIYSLNEKLVQKEYYMMLYNKNSNKKDYSNLIDKIIQVSSQSFNKSIKALNELTKKQISARVDKLQQFHKIDTQTKTMTLKLMNRRLTLLLQVYCLLRHKNWKTFQYFIMPILIDSSLNNISQKSSQAMQIFDTQLTFISQKISQIQFETQLRL